MLSRLAGNVFLGSLFGVVLLWGYFPKLYVMTWPPLALLALAAVSLVLWIVFSLDRIFLWLKRRSTQFGISLAITAVMLVAILGVVNWLATVNNKKWDVTQNKMHTLSDQSQKIARELKEPVTLRVWTTGLDKMSTNLDMRKFLENYQIASNGKIKLEIKNPNEDRPGAVQDGVKRDNLIIVRSAAGREARVDNFTDTKGEEQITNAIIQAIRGNKKKTVCFVSGHGEAPLDGSDAVGLSTIKSRLTDSSYDAKEIVLANAEKLPPECEAVVIDGPRSDATERETKMLQAYLESGGKMLALLGPGTPENWKKLVAQYGPKIRNDVIVDVRVQQAPVYVATKNYAQDVDIVKNFNQLVLLPEVSSIQVPTTPKDALSIKTFISSEAHTYAKVGDLRTIKSLQLSSGDLRGALPVGVLISKTVEPGVKATPEKTPVKKPAAPAVPAAPKSGHGSFRLPSLVPAAQAQDMPDDDIHHPGAHGDAAPAKDGPKDVKPEMTLIVISNSAFTYNAFVGQLGNLDLFLNSINQLLRDQDLIGIRPREIRQASLQISGENLRQVVATILIVAGLFLVGGIAATHRKRVNG